MPSLRIATWNINSVRLRIGIVGKLARDQKIDVLCLQETKVADSSFPHKAIRKLGFEHVAINGQKGYHGVAVLTRLPFESLNVRPYCGKSDCRHISVTLGANEIVDRWLEAVWDGVKEYVPGLLQLKGDLELYLGALHFKRLAQQKGLPVCLPKIIARDATAQSLPKKIEALWNPLLLAQERPPVSTDVTLPSFIYTCITTGPNSGGKTRFLQAIALSQLLGQVGCFVPAREASIRLVSGMFVSLGEAPHADQKEGRLGMELTRVRSLFEHAKGGSMVVLDELCSGTNPSEGEEIFRMLLELLHELEHEVHITTHFLSFAASLQVEAESLGLSFLQVELDATQHPTYRFLPGVATTSLAHQTAERLGVTREQLRQLIKRREDDPRGT